MKLKHTIECRKCIGKARESLRNQGIQKHLYILGNTENHTHAQGSRYAKTGEGSPLPLPPPISYFFLFLIWLLAFSVKNLCQNSSWTQTKGTENSETTYDQECRPYKNSLEKLSNKQLQPTKNTKTNLEKEGDSSFQSYYTQYSKCPVFNKRIKSTWRNKTVWHIHRWS